MRSNLNYQEFSSFKGDRPSKILILLHGLGASGHDLIGLAPLMASSLGEVVFIAPDAPFPCDMAPVGFQWYSLQSWTPESMLEGAHKALPILDSFIDSQLERFDLAAKDMVLGGFSQGAMMSLFAGLRRKEALAGILGFSGWMLESENLEGLTKTPVHLIHGEMDEIVPFQAWRNAMRILRDADYQVSGESRPGIGHWIDEGAIAGGIDFLKKTGF